MSTSRTVQYSVAIDSVIYGPSTNSFERADWIALALAALAALDQAGVRSHDQEHIKDLLDDRGYVMVGDVPSLPSGVSRRA